MIEKEQELKNRKRKMEEEQKGKQQQVQVYLKPPEKPLHPHIGSEYQAEIPALKDQHPLPQDE